MVPKISKRGSSFKGVAQYLFHDKGRAKTADRVAWSESVNCWSERPDEAWFEMWDTYRERNGLKAAAGVDRRGRDSTKPVLHYSLAWHPNEKPERADMRAAALASLKALGLEDHQAIIVAHRDGKHPHVHLVVNTIHPHTGKSAALDYSKEALSKWAEAHERDSGVIRCAQRVENNAERAAVKKQRAQEKVQAEFAKATGQEAPAAAPYRVIKDRSPTRPQWIDKRDVIDRMKALHAELGTYHGAARSITTARHGQEREAIERVTRQAIDTARDQVKQHYKPQWRTLYRDQKAEARHLARNGASPFERAAIVFGQADRLAGPGKRLSFREKVGLILIPGRLEKRLAVTHERERQDLARAQRTQTKTLTDRVYVIHREKMHTLTARHRQERDTERTHQQEERSKVTFARARDDLRREAAEPAPQPEIGKGPAEQFNAARDPAPAPEQAKETPSQRIIRQMREAGPRGRDDFGREM